MKKPTHLLLILVLLLGVQNLYPQQLEDRLIRHIEAITSLGCRPASGEHEKKTAEYVAETLRNQGFSPTIIPISYDTYQIDSCMLTICGESVEPVFLALYPYDQEIVFTGEATWVSFHDQEYPEMADEVVITDHPGMHFRLLGHQPKMIIVLHSDDYQQFATKDTKGIHLKILGRQLKKSSQHVELILGHPDANKQIVVSAHLDAWQVSPGANDNATGIAALMELAGDLKNQELPPDVAVRLVWFGAEELGMVGSRQFVENHLDELDKFQLEVNFDTLGGKIGPVIAGITDSSTENSLPSFKGFDPALSGKSIEAENGFWRIQHPAIIPLITSLCCDENTQQLLPEASTQTGIEYTPRNLLSDHLAFAAAGVPAISIQSQEHHIHSEDDLIVHIDKGIMEDCYILGKQIIVNAIRRVAKVSE